jgi:hypothetical protein
MLADDGVPEDASAPVDDDELAGTDVLEDTGVLEDGVALEDRGDALEDGNRLAGDDVPNDDGALADDETASALVEPDQPDAAEDGGVDAELLTWTWPPASAAAAHSPSTHTSPPRQSKLELHGSGVWVSLGQPATSHAKPAAMTRRCHCFHGAGRMPHGGARWMTCPVVAS